MVAEHTADPGDASSPWPKPKCWDVTSSSGFALWKLNIEALINSDDAGADQASTFSAPVTMICAGLPASPAAPTLLPP